MSIIFTVLAKIKITILFSQFYILWYFLNIVEKLHIFMYIFNFTFKNNISSFQLEKKTRACA